MKTRKNKGKTYEIHDNGSKPFFVTVTGKKISVEKNEDTYKLLNGKFTTIQKPHKHLFDKTVDKLFIGKKSPTGGYDGLKPSEAEGNTLLAKDGSKYLYIGSEIYEFSPMEGDTIEQYYSDIGHSDVPYPYAIGKTHIYILLDKVAIDKSFFDLKKPIYGQYYRVEGNLKMCVRGYQPTDVCKNKKQAKEQIANLKRRTRRLKTKLLQKRL